MVYTFARFPPLSFSQNGSLRQPLFHSTIIHLPGGPLVRDSKPLLEIPKSHLHHACDFKAGVTLHGYTSHNALPPYPVKGIRGIEPKLTVCPSMPRADTILTITKLIILLHDCIINYLSSLSLHLLYIL